MIIKVTEVLKKNQTGTSWSTSDVFNKFGLSSKVHMIISMKPRWSPMCWSVTLWSCPPVTPSREPGWLEGVLDGKKGLIPENYLATMIKKFDKKDEESGKIAISLEY